MKISSLLKVAALVIMTCTAGVSARDILLKGGMLTTLDDRLVESFGDDMNFMFAYRFSDGSIHLGHSKGIHTVTEYGCNDISYDNGKTWQNAPNGWCCGINTFEGLDHGKYQIGAWNPKAAKTHTLTLWKFNDETKQKEKVTSCTVELPYESQFLSHRDIIRLRDSNRLLATAYGAIAGARKCHAFVYSSDDDGRTWTYLSTIADDPEGLTPEGPDEATIFQLKDGRICCLYRDGGMEYVKQCFSSDGGATWTKPEAITLFKGAASPNGRVLSDGTIVAVTGRPNLYLLVDFTGTGTAYQKYEVYHGSGSSYASVLETAPNEIMVIYDESNFSNWRPATGFSRIHASSYKVVNNADAPEAVIDDPRDKGYDGAVHFVDNKRLEDERLLLPTYKSAVKYPGSLATYNVMAIPERPAPVLRLVSHGDGVDGNKFAIMTLANDTHSAKELTVAIEFRLNDLGEKMPQFQFCGTVGADDYGEFKGYLGYARFSLDKIELLKDGGIVSMPYDIGTTKFHAFVMKLNAADRSVKLYKEGETEPLLTTTMPINQGSGNISFGDGSNGIQGCTDVSWLAWTMK